MSDQSTGKRSLPSWMSSRVNDNKIPSGNGDNEGTAPQKSRDHSKRSGKEGTRSKQSDSCASSSDDSSFSRLLEGVVFVLSGFVNPERSTLRSQALEMGAEYRPDWSSDCTLLVCAFQNTPKFRQVQDDCGTIVSKDWISNCYSQKKLVEIERYLMHAGRPWRRGNTLPDTKKDEKTSVSRKSQKQTEAGSPSKPIATRKLNARKNEDINVARNCFSHSEVKKWAAADFTKTMLWLESQEEKPDPSEIRQIAIEGILTCLQDAISALEQKQDVHKMTEEWNFVPHVVEELAELDGAGNNKSSMSKEDLCKWATECKHIYEEELNNSNDDLRHAGENGKAKASSESGYDSDKTVVMTEEEIDLAYQAVASKISNCE